MIIRHLTSRDNVNDGVVIDPKKSKHGTIIALKVSDLSGWVDPLTHLNLDFPEHLMRVTNVVQRLELGFPVILERGQFVQAKVQASALTHLGKVDADERLELLNKTLRARNNAFSQAELIKDDP